MKYSVNVRIFIKFLTYSNFYRKRQKGSHAIFSNGSQSNVLTIEKMTHTYSQGHLKKLLKDFNLPRETLYEFLYK